MKSCKNMLSLIILILASFNFARLNNSKMNKIFATENLQIVEDQNESGLTSHNENELISSNLQNVDSSFNLSNSMSNVLNNNSFINFSEDSLYYYKISRMQTKCKRLRN